MRLPVWPVYMIGVAATLGLLGGGIAMLGRSATPSEIPRIGALFPGSKQSSGYLGEGLDALGYVEGKNIVVEWRFSDGRDAQLERFAGELVQDKVRLIVAQNPSGALAARKATSTIPIVFIAIADPVGLGLAKSLARPGGNVTGISTMPADLTQKQLELAKDILPGLGRVALLGRTGNVGSGWHIDDRAAFAAQLGLGITVYRIDGPADYERAFARMERDGMQAALLLPDAVFYASREGIAAIALRHRIPVIADASEYADAGALMSYGIPGYRPIYDRAAHYIDKILHGADPAELPVDQPLDLVLTLNVRVAENLAIAIPRGLLLRADKIIE